MPNAAYLIPDVLIKWWIAVLRPVISTDPNCDQPPIFSGLPYLKRTLSPETHWPSPPVAVTCLLNPGANCTFCKI